MSTLIEKREELVKLRNEWATLYKSKPDRNFDESEIATLQNKNEAMATLAKEVESLEAIEKTAGENERERERLTKGTGIIHPNGEMKGQEPRVKSIREIMAESAALKALGERGTGTAAFNVPSEVFRAKTLMTLSTLNTQATRMPGIRPIAVEERTVRDLFMPGNTNGNTIEYYEETTLTNNAAAVAEGGTKPESALAYTLRTENVRKIATWIPATRELLADIPQMQSIIEGRLRFMLERQVEYQLVNGDGTAPNISGILDRTGLQTTAAASADDALDGVLDAITLIRVNAFAEPDGIIMHPNDFAAMAKLRTADGIYLIGNPTQDPNFPLWGLPIRITTAATENTAIVGAFGSQAQIFDREDTVVTVSTEHSTYFIENKVAILAECRLALAVYRPAAFCTVTGL